MKLLRKQAKHDLSITILIERQSPRESSMQKQKAQLVELLTHSASSNDILQQQQTTSSQSIF